MKKDRALWTAMAVLLSILASPGSPAAAGGIGNLTGAYFAIGDVDGVETALTLKLDRDRNFSAVYSISGTVLFGDSFTNDQGVWKKTGAKEITARSISFDYLPPSESPPDGEVLTNTISTWVITFDSGLISGTVNVVGYDTTVNPLDPGTATPVFDVDGSFNGQAITVD